MPPMGSIRWVHLAVDRGSHWSRLRSAGVGVGKNGAGQIVDRPMVHSSRFVQTVIDTVSERGTCCNTVVPGPYNGWYVHGEGRGLLGVGVTTPSHR